MMKLFWSAPRIITCVLYDTLTILKWKRKEEINKTYLKLKISNKQNEDDKKQRRFTCGCVSFFRLLLGFVTMLDCGTCGSAAVLWLYRTCGYATVLYLFVGLNKTED